MEFPPKIKCMLNWNLLLGNQKRHSFLWDTENPVLYHGHCNSEKVFNFNISTDAKAFYRILKVMLE